MSIPKAWHVLVVMVVSHLTLIKHLLCDGNSKEEGISASHDPLPTQGVEILA